MESLPSEVASPSVVPATLRAPSGESGPENEKAKTKRGSPDEGRPDAPPGTYTVTLPNFEGPLDLLLHLCQKHELDVLDIPISFVTQKYLEYLAVMRLMDLDVAAEYLVMAATLAHIKSKMLLPTPPAGQEEDAAEDEADPRETLIRRLLEYQKYKLAAEQLVARGVTGSDFFYRGAPVEAAVETDLPPLAEIPLFSLVEAFQRVLSKSKIKLTHDIVADRITITDRMNELTVVLQRRRRLMFEQLFEGLTTRFDLVITFLALLEMARQHLARLYQTEPLAPLWVESATSPVQEEGATDGAKGGECAAAAPGRENAEGDTALRVGCEGEIGNETGARAQTAARAEIAVATPPDPWENKGTSGGADDPAAVPGNAQDRGTTLANLRAEAKPEEASPSENTA